MLLVIRVRSGAPWWFVILVATALGWSLSNASVYLQHLTFDDQRRLDSQSYKPIIGLAYGPLYLLYCALPYWLVVGRRSSTGMTPQIVWLSAAALLLEWTAIAGAMRRGGYPEQFLRHSSAYVVPPVTIALAVLIGWLVATHVLKRFETRAKE